MAPVQWTPTPKTARELAYKMPGAWPESDDDEGTEGSEGLNQAELYQTTKPAAKPNQSTKSAAEGSNTNATPEADQMNEQQEIQKVA